MRTTSCTISAVRAGIVTLGGSGAGKLRIMALARDQAILTVTTKGTDVDKAVLALEARLQDYPDARIGALTHTIDQWSGFTGAKTTLVAVVDYNPALVSPAGAE